MHLVDFIIRINHDARSPERQVEIVKWRQVAQDRDGLRRANGEAFIRLGYWSHRRLLLSSSSPLCRVIILIFLRQTVSLGNTVLQLFSC